MIPIKSHAFSDAEGVAFLYGTIYVGLKPAVHFSAEAEAEFTGTVSAMVGARVESGRIVLLWVYRSLVLNGLDKRRK